MRRAFERETGVADALAGVAFQGRTDRWIVNEVGRLTGVDPAQLWDRYRSDYPPLMRDELAVRNPRVLPGVRELLVALEDRDDAVVGLATGNQREASFIKLSSVGLDRHFDRGGFGDRHEERADMVREAMAEVGWRPGERLVVIGDSEARCRGGARGGRGGRRGRHRRLERSESGGARRAHSAPRSR